MENKTIRILTDPPYGNLEKCFSTIHELIGIVEKAEREGWDISVEDKKIVDNAKILIGFSTRKD